MDEDGKGEGEVVIYRTDDGADELQLRLVDGTVWLTQAEIATLFQSSKQNISHHIKEVLSEGELTEEATVKSYLTVRTEGARQVRRSIKLFNLKMILAIGYRVRSPRGAQFRRWATETLNEYLVKGFVMNDERLKDPAWDYFDELLERIRDIRASEKRFYQKVRDLFAATSSDYDKASDTAKTFFATIQNKLVYAVTGMTAPELVLARADATKPNMALTSWKGERVRKGDVTVSKNYLSGDEADTLNRLVTGFLEFAELRAKNRQATTMQDWAVQTDRFVAFNERAVLQGAGSVSHPRMEKIAHERYESFDEKRRRAEAEAAEREALAELEQIEDEARRLPKPTSKPKRRAAGK